MRLGPFKIFATADTGSSVAGKLGWFYPLYLDEKEAMKADISFKGKGIYSKISFVERFGEFYFPDSYKFLAQLTDPIIYENYLGSGKENKFSRIQNKLSSIVPSQFPDFVQSEYFTFVDFIKAYYQFLEQDNGCQEVLSNIRQYNDIDKTTSDLVEKFLNSYAIGYTNSNITDNKFIIKNISQIFDSKGTEKAYDILFNVLYKETIEFFYPSTVILSPSDAVWETRRFLRSIKTNDNQDYYLFKDSAITGQISKATSVITNVIKINIGPYEVFELELDPKQTMGTFVSEQITAEKTILDEQNNLVRANLIADIQGNIISSINVTRTERGFAENQILSVIDLNSSQNSPGGVGALIRVKRVDNFSRIKEIEVLDPGINYSANLALAGIATIPVDYALYSVLEEDITISFQYAHDYIVGDVIEVLNVGRPDSNILGQFYLANVVSVLDKYTLITFAPPERNLREIRNPISSLALLYCSSFNGK